MRAATSHTASMTADMDAATVSIDDATSHMEDLTAHTAHVASHIEAATDNRKYPVTVVYESCCHTT